MRRMATWHALAVHLVRPAGQAGRLRRVSLCLRTGGEFLVPGHWVGGLLRLGGANLTALELDLRGSALAADFSDQLADGADGWGLPPTLRELTIDASGLRTCPQQFAMGCRHSGRNYALLRLVTQRRQVLERLVLRLETNASGSIAFNNVMHVRDLLTAPCPALRNLEVDVGDLSRCADGLEGLPERYRIVPAGAIARLARRLGHGARLDRLVLGIRGAHRCGDAAAVIQEALAPALINLRARMPAHATLQLRLGCSALPEGPEGPEVPEVPSPSLRSLWCAHAALFAAGVDCTLGIKDAEGTEAIGAPGDTLVPHLWSFRLRRMPDDPARRVGNDEQRKRQRV